MGLKGSQLWFVRPTNWSGTAPCWTCSRRQPFLLELTGASPDARRWSSPRPLLSTWEDARGSRRGAEVRQTVPCRTLGETGPLEPRP